MKERPILFSAPMVRAILAGTKTQTRRVVKPQPSYQGFDGPPKFTSTWGEFCYPAQRGIRCPYGQPGDRLWVRETHGFFMVREDSGVTALSKGQPVDGDGFKPHYRATDDLGMPDGAWRPSIHMPRWASRILLEIVSVRVERLQDISEADSIAEGINCHPFRPDDGFPICNGYTHEANDGRCMLWATAKLAYLKLWESINGPGSWDANPFVWVVKFKRVTP